MSRLQVSTHVTLINKTTALCRYTGPVTTGYIHNRVDNLVKFKRARIKIEFINI